MYNRFPLLWPLLGLCSGILLSAYFLSGAQTLNTVLPVAFLVFAAIILLLYKWHNALGIYFIFCLIGVLLTQLQDARLDQSHFTHTLLGQSAFYSGYLTEHPVKTQNAVRLEIDLYGVNKTNCTGRIYLYVPQKDDIYAHLPGDKIQFKAVIKPILKPSNPHEFDYQNYLHLHQIFGQAFTNDYTLHTTAEKKLWRLRTKARNALLKVIREMQLSQEEEAIAAAILVGYRHFITDETTQAFAGAGAMHILAVSGLHVGILYVVTTFLLGIDKNKPHRATILQVLGTLICIWLYALLTGLSPSVTRASVMFTFIAGSYLFKRKSSSIQAILTSALFLLALRPNYLFEVGFQLSYAAVLGIVYLQPLFYKIMPTSRFMVITWIFKITAVSLAAQAATFPFGLYYFHQFPMLFMLSNILVIPLATVTMYYGLFLLLIFSFSTPISWLVIPLKALLWLMINGVKAVQEIPGAVLQGIWISRLQLVVLLILVFALVELFFKRKKWALFASLGMSILYLFSLNLHIYTNQFSNTITVYSIKKNLAIEAKKGREGVLVATPELLKNVNALRFHITHNQWANGLKNISQIPLGKDTTSAQYFQHDGLLALYGQRILVYQNDMDSAKITLKPSLIVVNNNVNPPKRPIDIPVVLNHNMSPSYKRTWRKYHHGTHDLQESGAFTLSF